MPKSIVCVSRSKRLTPGMCHRREASRMRVVAITAYESLKKTVRATLRTVTSPLATRLISMASRMKARSIASALRSVGETDVGEQRQPDLLHLPWFDDATRRQLANRPRQ